MHRRSAGNFATAQALYSFQADLDTLHPPWATDDRQLWPVDADCIPRCLLRSPCRCATAWRKRRRSEHHHDVRAAWNCRREDLSRPRIAEGLVRQSIGRNIQPLRFRMVRRLHRSVVCPAFVGEEVQTFISRDAGSLRAGGGARLCGRSHRVPHFGRWRLRHADFTAMGYELPPRTRAHDAAGASDADL